MLLIIIKLIDNRRKRLYLVFIVTNITIVYNSQVNNKYKFKKILELLLPKNRKKKSNLALIM